MQFVKFSLLTIFFVSFAFAEGQFSSKECLDSSFDTIVKTQKKYFGLLDERFSIKKDACLIEVVYKNILTTKWIVDVCREPLHIKVEGKSGLSVFKKTDKECGSMENDFCFQSDELKRYLQDQGLVFAQGEKENIQTPHGQVYCTYLLLQRYLDDDIIFSKFAQDVNVFESKKESCDLPVVETKKSSPLVEPIVSTPKESLEPVASEEKRKF